MRGKMMRRLRFCCEGVDIISLTAEPKKKITIIENKKTEQWSKASDATVIPPKRKCVKNMVCNCFVNCICAKCLKINTNTISPPSHPGNQFNYISYYMFLT